MEHETILGIDLGTTTSCVAVLEGDRPVVIPNRGHLTTPSIVAVAANGKTLVGHVAKRQAVTNAENTVRAIKRLIGRPWDSSEVRAALGQGNNLVEGPNRDVRVQLREKLYALPELNALILSDLKNAAEEHLGHAVSKAVITVPAYFNDGQRQATRDAGTIAGLEVVRMIHEPTAAAVAYGYGRGRQRTIVVYDLGGGTFDISIVRAMPDGTFEVLGSGGHTFLGGEDFDRLLQDWLLEKFRQDQGIDLSADRVSLQRLREAAEEAKISLTERESVDVDIPFVATRNGEPVHLRYSIDRATFDAMTEPLIRRTVELTKEAVREAKLELKQVDDLLLVGGSTRVPAVNRAVTALLGRRPAQGVHPDEAVAIGAAIHGQSLVSKEVSVKLLDVTPYTLGIRLRGNRREPIIARHSRIPTSCTRNFRTTRENQSHVDVVILQGESPNADENVLLGHFRLTELAAGPAGSVSIDVSVAVDESGVVHVGARDVGTGKEHGIQIVGSTGLTLGEVREMAAARRAREAGSEPSAPLGGQAEVSPPPPSSRDPHRAAAKLPPGTKKPKVVRRGSKPNAQGAPMRARSKSQPESWNDEDPTIPHNDAAPNSTPTAHPPPNSTPEMLFAKETSAATVPPPPNFGDAIEEYRPQRASPTAKTVAAQMPEALAAPPTLEPLPDTPRMPPSLDQGSEFALPGEPPRLDDDFSLPGAPPSIDDDEEPPPPLKLPQSHASPEKAPAPGRPPERKAPQEAPRRPGPSLPPTTPSMPAAGGGGGGFSLPPLESLGALPSMPPAMDALPDVGGDAPPPAMGGFRAQLEEIIVNLEFAASRSTIALGSTDYGRSALKESQDAIARAREAAATNDEQAMRNAAFELARIEQLLASLSG